MKLTQRVFLCAATVAMAAAGVLAVPAPAAAQPTSVAIYPNYWVNVSSNGGKTVNNNDVDALVGTYTKAGRQIASRAYYRFNTSALAGKNILSAKVRHQQLHSPNLQCNLPAFGPGVQVGQTDPVSSTTAWPGPAWRGTLATNARAHGNRSTCPGYTNLDWDVELAVEQAAASQQGNLTFGFRSADESNLDGFRTFESSTSFPILLVQYNSTPDAPSDLSIVDPAAPCATAPDSPEHISSTGPRLRAWLNDADGSSAELYATFEISEAGTPIWSQTSSFASRSGSPEDGYVPEQTLLHDHTYSFRVRVEEPTAEGTLYSPWSESCHFKVDTHYPRPPEILSEDYPECDETCTPAGGPGQPGEFTFTSDPDVVEYHYEFNGGYEIVRPSTPGAPVTVTLTPDSPGISILHVEVADAAHNTSVKTTYFFNVSP